MSRKKTRLQPGIASQMWASSGELRCTSPPVLGQHHGVLDLGDAAEELRSSSVRPDFEKYSGCAPWCRPSGPCSPSGQAFEKGYVEGNLQLGHRVSPLLVFDYGPLLYTKAEGRDSDAGGPGSVDDHRCGTSRDGNGKPDAETRSPFFVSRQFFRRGGRAYALLDQGLGIARELARAPNPGKGGAERGRTDYDDDYHGDGGHGCLRQWRLYVNRDNKAGSLERAYVSNDDCDRAAHDVSLGTGARRRLRRVPAARCAAPTPRPVDYAPQPDDPLGRRADEPARVSTSRSSASSRRVSDPRDLASGGRGARPRSGGRDRVSSRGGHLSAERRHGIRSDEAPAPTVVASRPVAEPRRHAVPRPFSVLRTMWRRLRSPRRRPRLRGRRARWPRGRQAKRR